MSFDIAYGQLEESEGWGAFTDNPDDPGGATRYGITEREARANDYTGDMRELPADVAKRIAKAQYWDKYQCDAMPAAVAFQVFDAAYNGGHAVRWLQQAAGVVVDGILGPETLKAASEVDPYLIVARFNAYRLTYMTALPTWETFGKGWANRIADNLLRG